MAVSTTTIDRCSVVLACPEGSKAWTLKVCAPSDSSVYAFPGGKVVPVPQSEALPLSSLQKKLAGSLVWKKKVAARSANDSPSDVSVGAWVSENVATGVRVSSES